MRSHKAGRTAETSLNISAVSPEAPAAASQRERAVPAGRSAASIRETSAPRTKSVMAASGTPQIQEADSTWAGWTANSSPAAAADQPEAVHLLASARTSRQAKRG